MRGSGEGGALRPSAASPGLQTDSQTAGCPVSSPLEADRVDDAHFS